MGVALLFLGLLTLLLLGDLVSGPGGLKLSKPSRGDENDVTNPVDVEPSIKAMIAGLAPDGVTATGTARTRNAAGDTGSPSRKTLQHLIGEHRPLGAGHNMWKGALSPAPVRAGAGSAKGLTAAPAANPSELLKEIVFTPLVLGKKRSDDVRPLASHSRAAETQGQPMKSGKRNLKQASGLPPTEIRDFKTDQDVLRILLPPETAQADPDIVFAPSTNGVDGVVTVNGDVVAILRGAADASGIDVFVDVIERRHA